MLIGEYTCTNKSTTTRIFRDECTRTNTSTKHTQVQGRIYNRRTLWWWPSIYSSDAFWGSGKQSTVGRMTMKSTRRVLGHSLLRSLVRLHRSLIRLLRTARFARALRCAHSLARSLTRSLRSSWESSFCLWIERVDFIQFETTVHCIRRPVIRKEGGLPGNCASLRKQIG